MPPPGRPRRLAALALALLVLAVVAGSLALAGRGQAPVRTQTAMVPVVDGPDDDQHVDLDTTLYLPGEAYLQRHGPVPALIGSHGFGGDKDDLRGQAEALARHGYVVLLYSARGFGDSTGRIGVDSPDYEVKDVRQLIDLLARRPEVRLDAPGDPRVGLFGPSYGGGITLMAAGYDKRIDAIVPVITWNSLVTAFSPNAASPDGGEAGDPVGVFKRLWAAEFFHSSSTSGDTDDTSDKPSARPDNGDRTDDGHPDDRRAAPATPDVCGHFVSDFCAAYTATAVAGRATPQALEILRRSSPASVLDRITAPTLLIQGEADTLFPLDEARRNAEGIAAHGTPVSTMWIAGGHDAPSSKAENRRIDDRTLAWFDHWLKGDASASTGPAFSYARPGGPVGSADALPGSLGQRQVALHPVGDAVPGRPDTRAFVNPPGGQPSAVTGLPGSGALGALSGLLSRQVTGQFATFESDPLPRSVELVGGGQVTLRVGSSTGSATLFVKLYDASDSAATTDDDSSDTGDLVLPDQLLAPVRVVGLPTDGTGSLVTVQLPAVSHTFPGGHRMRLVVASTDQAWAGEAQPAVYTATLAGPLVLPVAPPAPGETAVWLVVVSVTAAVLVAAAVTVPAARARRRRRDARAPGRPGHPPVVVRGLTKRYRDGTLAVDDVSFTVAPGEVVGLLGPNGAGKTTTLRMLLGLTRPDAGTVELFGERVRPSAPVLARVGAFVEGPGFLPHLTGIDNLKLWWRAGGADWADAAADEALSVAGLGDAVHRPVRTYSQGMRQRLAIAQAMLARPDLLVLDEPTNGLDPPQIHQMREVIRRVAASGRTVLLSSHLLAEVEQVCTSLVVMAGGRLVAAGPTAEMVGAGTTATVETPQPARAAQLLRTLAGVTRVEEHAGAVLVELDGLSRPEIVAALVHGGVPVSAVGSRRRLEDVFLGLVGGR